MLNKIPEGYQRVQVHHPLTHSLAHSVARSLKCLPQTNLCKLRQNFTVSCVQKCTASFCSSQHVACCLAESLPNLVPLLLELGIFEDLGHKQGSMQGGVGVHGASNGLHQ